MAPTLEQIMDGIEARLATISGLRTADVGPSAVNVPIAVVGVPTEIDYHGTMKRGIVNLDFVVTVFTSSASDRSGQKALAGYMNPTGATSIVTAIEADKTLGGVVDNCVVRTAQSLGLVQVGGVEYYAANFTVRVLAQGN